MQIFDVINDLLESARDGIAVAAGILAVERVEDGDVRRLVRGRGMHTARIYKGVVFVQDGDGGKDALREVHGEEDEAGGDNVQLLRFLLARGGEEVLNQAWRHVAAFDQADGLRTA